MTLRERIAEIVLVYDPGQGTTEEDDEAARQLAFRNADRVLEEVAKWVESLDTQKGSDWGFAVEVRVLAQAIRGEKGEQTP